MAEESLTAQAETTQEAEQAQEPKGHLNGDGDWNKAENYPGFEAMPPETQEAFRETLKKQQANLTRKYQEVATQKPPFAYNSVDEALKDPRFRAELEAVSAKEEETNQAVESGAEYMKDVVRMTVNKQLSEAQIRNYMATLSAPEQVTYETAVQQAFQNQKNQEDNLGRVDLLNQEKYGDQYIALKPKFSEVYNSASANPQEIAFRNLDYDANYKRGYEAGLRETGSSKSSLNSTSGIGESNQEQTNDKRPTSPAEAMKSTLREQNWTDADIARHLGHV